METYHWIVVVIGLLWAWYAMVRLDRGESEDDEENMDE